MFSIVQRPGMRILSVILILIAYGSLYPGNFSRPPEGSVERFLTDFRWFTSLGDVLGNIALFFPFGMAAILLMAGRRDNRIPGLLVLAFVYAFALQLAQVWLPSRSAAMADVMWNMVGTVLGIIVGMAVPRPGFSHESKAGRAVVPQSLLPLSILGLWLLMELLPLVPSLDWQKFKDALKPLIQDTHFSFSQAMMHGAGTVVAGGALLALGWFSSAWLGIALAIVFAGKVVIVGQMLDISAVLGMGAGYLGCLYVLRRRRDDPTVVFAAAFVLLLIAWTLVRITPFVPGSGGAFNALPFATLLQGSMEDAAKGLVQSLFIYTSLLWLARNTGMSLKKTVMALFVWSSLLELIQMGLLGRTADITEPLLVLLVGWVFPTLQAQALPVGIGTAASAGRAIGRSASNPPLGVKIPKETSPKYIGVQLFAVITIGTLLVWSVTQSSFVPYNVRELIYEGHPFRSALLLALLMFWVIGFPVLILYWLAKGRRYLPAFLPLVLIHGFVAWLLLWSSVPTESLHDIVGAPVLHWPWEWELLGRFIALFNVWSIAATGGCLAAALRFFPDAKSMFFAWAITCLLLIPVSYHVVIVEASTDNLVELIDGGGSVPAFLLISLAAGIITFSGAKLALALIRTATLTQAVVLALMAGILSHTALYFGLEQVIVKDQQVFSAMQFILSKDRANLAGPAELLARYSLLYIGFVTTVIIVQNPLWRWTLNGLQQQPGPVSASQPLSRAKH